MNSSVSHVYAVWLIGILQPVSIKEAFEVLNNALEEEERVSIDVLAEVFKSCLAKELIIRVHRRPDLFSVTAYGNKTLNKSLRHSRDKLRLFLLKKVNRSRVHLSCDVLDNELGDDMSSSDVRQSKEGRETNKFGLCVPRVPTCWSRPSRQILESGHVRPSHDIPSAELLSFFQPVQLSVAMKVRAHTPADRPIPLNSIAISLMLGVSQQLIESICAHNIGSIKKKKENIHYRTFELPKRGGNTRKISTPRTFLKVVLWFLNDFYLGQLKVHAAVQSFRQGRSIIDNARLHLGRRYVSTIDIQDYFGSITFENVCTLLQSNGFDQESSKTVASLCTKDNALPQGAPTSPVISNAYLYSFDEEMHQSCQARGQTYSRYADDITISGGDKAQIMDAVDQARRILYQDYGLLLNPKKTRIASRNSQQNVTGIVVNEKLLPPRKKRMKIRAAFHVAKKFGLKDVKQLNELRGYYGYLNAFPELKNSPALLRYKETLDYLTKEIRNTPNP